VYALQPCDLYALLTWKQLHCVLEMTYIFAVNFTWKSLPPKTNTNTSMKRTPQSLGTLNLEITLDTSVANSWPGPVPCWSSPDQPWSSPNLHSLTKAAFQPRCFEVMVEKGNFIPDLYIGQKEKKYYQWGLRLVFDHSPYPAQEGLVHPAPGYDCSGRFDEMTTCVARKLRQSRIEGRAMNDPTFTMGDFMRPIRRMLGLETDPLHMCPPDQCVSAMMGDVSTPGDGSPSGSSTGVG
jgi:hypothetical protein